MKYKLICSDLDDTLLTGYRTYHPELKASIHRYIDGGGKFMIATGRMTSGVLPIARELELSGEIVTFQGAVVADISSGEIISGKAISTLDAAKALKYIEGKGYYSQIYIGDTFATQKAQQFTLTYANISVAEYIETGIPLSEYVQQNKISPPKILVCAEQAEIPDILNELKCRFSDKFLVNTSKPWLVEMVHKSVNKAAGISTVANKYGIKPQEIICIGDSLNDVEMLKFAGLAAVVENGSDDAKQYADIIAPACLDNGVGWVIDNYGYIE